MTGTGASRSCEKREEEEGGEEENDEVRVRLRVRRRRAARRAVCVVQRGRSTDRGKRSIWRAGRADPGVPRRGRWHDHAASSDETEATGALEAEMQEASEKETMVKEEMEMEVEKERRKEFRSRRAA